MTTQIKSNKGNDVPKRNNPMTKPKPPPRMMGPVILKLVKKNLKNCKSILSSYLGLTGDQAPPVEAVPPAIPFVFVAKAWKVVLWTAEPTADTAVRFQPPHAPNAKNSAANNAGGARFLADALAIGSVFVNKRDFLRTSVLPNRTDFLGMP